MALFYYIFLLIDCEIVHNFLIIFPQNILSTLNLHKNLTIYSIYGIFGVEIKHMFARFRVKVINKPLNMSKNIMKGGGENE